MRFARFYFKVQVHLLTRGKFKRGCVCVLHFYFSSAVFNAYLIFLSGVFPKKPDEKQDEMFTSFEWIICKVQIGIPSWLKLIVCVKDIEERCKRTSWQLGPNHGLYLTPPKTTRFICFSSTRLSTIKSKKSNPGYEQILLPRESYDRSQNGQKCSEFGILRTMHQRSIKILGMLTCIGGLRRSSAAAAASARYASDEELKQQKFHKVSRRKVSPRTAAGSTSHWIWIDILAQGSQQDDFALNLSLKFTQKSSNLGTLFGLRIRVPCPVHALDLSSQKFLGNFGQDVCCLGPV